MFVLFIQYEGTICTVSPRMFVLFVWGRRVYLFHNVCLRFQASGTGAAALPAALNRKLTAFHRKRKFSPSAEVVGTTIPTGSGSHPAGSKLNSTRTWLHCSSCQLTLPEVSSLKKLSDSPETDEFTWGNCGKKTDHWRAHGTKFAQTAILSSFMYRITFSAW